MNERIKELAKEARLLTGWPVGEVEFQKFAELIIEECIVIIGREIDETESKEKNRTISDMMDLLERHFGVK